MPQMKIATFVCLPLLCCAVGCANETRTYSMSVKNELPSPVSVCITKQNSPPELGWEAPEDLILPPNPPSDQTPPGMVIPAGKTLKVTNQTGRFNKERGRAILRVYAGTPNLSEMNAISMGAPNRLDVPLKLGENRMSITQQGDGSLKVVVKP